MRNIIIETCITASALVKPKRTKQTLFLKKILEPQYVGPSNGHIQIE